MAKSIYYMLWLQLCCYRIAAPGNSVQTGHTLPERKVANYKERLP